MSLYENYNKTSTNYDKTRVPIGLEIILGCFAKSGKPLNEMIVLDAGCGTGTYSHALLEYVRRIDAIDINPAMVEIASRKLKRHREEGRITFSQSSIDALPFTSRMFDAIMINQVLHHLDNPNDQGYPTHHRMLREFHRVLRPKGILVINTCSHEQLRHGFWYYRLIPEAVDEILRRYMPMDQLIEMLFEYGFTYQGSFVPLNDVLQGEAYFDPRGPLKKQWRDGDSVFALVTPDHLYRVWERISDMDSRGELSRFVKEHDSQRKVTGQATFILAVRE